MIWIREEIIVTVENEKNPKENHFNYDMEIPLKISIFDLVENILTLVHQYNSSINISVFHRKLYCKRLQRVLYDNETVESAEIWNGDELIVS